MKYIEPKDLPDVLDAGTIEILVQMVLEFPKKTFAWAEVSKVLKERDQLNIILEEAEKVKRQIALEKSKSMTEEEIADDEKKWKKIKGDNDPTHFYGNMGQPETCEEYKRRYGVWPPGDNN